MASTLAIFMLMLSLSDRAAMERRAFDAEIGLDQVSCHGALATNHPASCRRLLQ